MVLLSKLYWSAMHDDPCVCTCGFCDQDCKTIKRVSPSFLMSHMFVPAPFSSLSLLLFCTNGIVYATSTLGTTSMFLNYTFPESCTLFFPDVLNKTASSIDEAPFFLVPNRTYIPQLLSWIMRSGRRQACEQRDYRYSYGELACCCSSSQSMGAQKDIQLLEL